MADNKKYYYLKLKESFFETDAMIILESLPDGYLYSNILLKLYLKSLKGDGKLMFNDRIPYNPNLLAQITRHPVGVVEKALKIFEEFELIEIMDNGAIYMLDIQNFIGKSSTEADRQREYQSKIIEEKKVEKIECKKTNKKSNMKSTPEIEIEKEIEKEKEIDIELEIEDNMSTSPSLTRASATPYIKFKDSYNRICKSLPKILELTKKRKDKLKSLYKQLDYDDDSIIEIFERAEQSDFLSGRSGKWANCSFDWLINHANAIKVLEGNYDNKAGDKQEKSSNIFYEIGVEEGLWTENKQ